MVKKAGKGDQSKAMQTLYKLGTPIKAVGDDSVPTETNHIETEFDSELLTPGETLDAFIMNFLDRLSSLEERITALENKQSQ